MDYQPQAGDLFARKDTDLTARVIQLVTDGPWSHVGMVHTVLSDGGVWLIEMVRSGVRFRYADAGDYFFPWVYGASQKRSTAQTRFESLITAAAHYSYAACLSDGVQALWHRLTGQQGVIFDQAGCFNCSEAFAYAVGLDFRGMTPNQVVRLAQAG